MSLESELTNRLLVDYGVLVVPKEHNKFMRAIDVFLQLLSLGKFQGFMGNYVTTIGRTIYTPRMWSELTEMQRVITLRHEEVHLKQAIRLGSFLFSFLYLLGGLPLGAAYFRMKFEREAYEETLVAHVGFLGLEILDKEELRAVILSQFEGPAYLWMWPYKKSNRRWYAAATARIYREHVQKPSNV